MVSVGLTGAFAGGVVSLVGSAGTGWLAGSCFAMAFGAGAGLEATFGASVATGSAGLGSTLGCGFGSAFAISTDGVLVGTGLGSVLATAAGLRRRDDSVEDNSSMVGSVSTLRIRRETRGINSTGSDLTGEIAMGVLRTTGTEVDLLSTRMGVDGAVRAIDDPILGGCGTCELGVRATCAFSFGSRKGAGPLPDRWAVLLAWLRWVGMPLQSTSRSLLTGVAVRALVLLLDELPPNRLPSKPLLEDDDELERVPNALRSPPRDVPRPLSCLPTTCWISALSVVSCAATRLDSERVHGVGPAVKDVANIAAAMKTGKRRRGDASCVMS